MYGSSGLKACIKINDEFNLHQDFGKLGMSNSKSGVELLV